MPGIRAVYGTAGGLSTPRARGGWRVGVRKAVIDLSNRSFDKAGILVFSERIKGFTFPFTPYEEGDWHRNLVDAHGKDLEFGNGAQLLFPWRKEYFEACSITEHDYMLHQRPHLLAIAACVDQVLDGLVDQPDKLDRVGCVVILEKSEKVRIVTPNEDVVAFVGSCFNGWLLDLLKQDPRVDPFEEPKTVSPAGVAVPEGFVLRSVDLVRASDQISGYDHLGILKGVLSGLNIPHDSVFGRTLLFFARAVMVTGKFPNGEAFTFPTRGQPAMGRGPTWPALSIYTLWCTLAASPILNRVVGDDALFASSEQGSKAFNERLKLHGGEVNDLKDVESTCGGTLVERCCLLNQERKIEWHDAISVANLDGNPKVMPGGECLPRWMAGPSIKYAPGVEYICEKTFCGEFAEFRRVGLDPFLPREFGGPGFPCSSKRLVKAIRSLRPQWVRALRVAISQGQAGLRVLLSLQTPWKMSRSSMAKSIEDRLLAEILDEQNNKEEMGEKLWSGSTETGLTITEFSRRVEAQLVAAKAIWDGFGDATLVRPSISQVAQQIGIAVREANWLVPKSRLSDKVVNMHEGLMKYLMELRLGFFRMPQRYRTSPPLGTTMGYQHHTGAGPDFSKDPAEAWVRPAMQPVSLREPPMLGGGRIRQLGLLPIGTNMGMEPRFGWKWRVGTSSNVPADPPGRARDLAYDLMDGDLSD